MDREDTTCPWCNEPSGHVASLDTEVRDIERKHLHCVSCGRKLKTVSDENNDGEMEYWFERAA